MLVAAIVIFLTGAVIGLRFRVFAVVPLVLIGWFGFAVTGMTVDAGLVSNALGLIGIALLAQLGFMFGVSARFATAAARVGRRRSDEARASKTPPIRPAVQ